LALLRIRHRTQYLYNKPVQLGPHRLVLRPRESRDLRLTAMDISTTPPSSITWAGDVFGNAIATASFDAVADNLVIESTVALELTSAAWPIFPIAASAASYPFRYSADERADLGALLQPQYLDPTQRLAAWARGFVHANPTDTLSLLKDINAGVSATVCYQARDDEGTQSPSHTLNSARGSCRDMAVLFAESCRVLGFGARLVSGYLHNPASPMGTTHAWAEVFVPGAGWITFDPTNSQMGGFNLIPVAVARDLSQAMPVSGSFVGGNTDLARMTVAVQVEPHP
jgi:transglutaminase-like putative cysteine protease